MRARNEVIAADGQRFTVETFGRRRRVAVFGRDGGGDVRPVEQEPAEQEPASRS